MAADHARRHAAWVQRHKGMKSEDTEVVLVTDTFRDKFYAVLALLTEVAYRDRWSRSRWHDVSVEVQWRVNAYIRNKGVIMTNSVNEDDRHLFKALRAMVMAPEVL